MPIHFTIAAANALVFVTSFILFVKKEIENPMPLHISLQINSLKYSRDLFTDLYL